MAQIQFKPNQNMYSKWLLLFIIQLALTVQQESEQNPYPYVVRLKCAQQCTGIIINRYYVLASANCVWNSGCSVVIDGNRWYSVSKIIALNQHHTFDIALLRSTILFTDNGPNLAHLADENSTLLEGVELMAIFNYDYHGISGQQVKIVNQESCAKIYGMPEMMKESTVCVVRTDQCDSTFARDDNGRVLILNGTVYGISSFGSKCPKEHSPAVYTKISAVRHLISDSM